MTLLDVIKILAIVALVIFVVMTVAVIYYRRQGWRMTYFHLVLYIVDHMITRTLWRARIVGKMPLRPGQGAVIICNHTSSVDPMFVQMLIPQAVHWMVAKEYCESRTFGWLLRVMGTIPVNRGGADTASSNLAAQYAKQGELVGVFPEGKLNTTDEILLPGRTGAAMIALKAQVPVIPCFIQGAPRVDSILGPLMRTAKVRLHIGPAIDISEYYGQERVSGVYELLTRRFLTEIARLGGVENYEPKLAGRRWNKENEAAEAAESGRQIEE
ncbi:MAG: lysophospholipid acyltransferase family protein [Planctomycetota bacterium]|nr:lysophospholipid acyltransferase family protein [Planctomycetota bacterium]